MAATCVPEEAISRADCLALLETAAVGRVAVSIGALPAILPVNYVVIGDSIVFPSDGAGALFRASVGSVVAFEAEGYAEADSSTWNILVRGVAAELSETSELARSPRLARWRREDRLNRFVVVPTTDLTGRRFE